MRILTGNQRVRLAAAFWHIVKSIRIQALRAFFFQTLSWGIVFLLMSTPAMARQSGVSTDLTYTFKSGDPISVNNGSYEYDLPLLDLGGPAWPTKRTAAA